MFALALTGGIASGKSLFARMLAGLGAETIDADDVVRSLHCSGAPGAQAVAELFGASCLAPDGSTDRRRLAAVVFGDSAERRRLENALHPLIRSAILAWKNSPSKPGCALRVAQIPLLFECGWTSDWDASASVETADIDVRLSRMAGRGLSRAEALSRVASQLPAEDRLRRSDFAIRNDSSAEALELLARHLFSETTHIRK